MRRSVRVELSTCHKVHLPPQISLSCSSIPRHLLGKCQHHTRFFSAVPFQELCTVDCPLPPYPKYCLHIYPHQITFDLFACTKLLLSPNIVTYYCFDEHHKYSTIILHMLKYYYYHTKCSNTTIITQYAQILLFSLHSATNPLRWTWARVAAQVVGNYMSGYGTLGSGILHSTCASAEIQIPTCINIYIFIKHIYIHVGL